MRQIVVLPEAVRDVEAQADYYERQGTPATADRWERQTARTFEFVARNPRLGASIRPGLRAWRVEKFKRHVVIYREFPDRVEIVRVLPGSADLDAALGP
jgi:plasmid stabilization system protein ParE